MLYDVTSIWMEGRCCPLARHGYSRDGKRGKPQIVFGLLCDAEGCPVAVEVFEGDTADPATLGAQIDTLRKRFALTRMVLVGDRGLLTSARIREDMEPAGLDWISALRAPAIRELASSGACAGSSPLRCSTRTARRPPRPPANRSSYRPSPRPTRPTLVAYPV